MTKWIFAVLVLVPLLARGGSEEAVEAYRSGDYAAAMTQFRQLADQGDASAMYYVGEIYHRGYGIEADQVQAAKWYRQAAERGDSLSQYQLGMMAMRGEGMAKDLVQAHLWLALSARNAPNPRDAAYTQQEIKKLERRMAPEQIADAKKLAAAWKPEK